MAETKIAGQVPDTMADVPGYVYSGSADAVSIKRGTGFITTAGVNALTIAAPTAGTDDNKPLDFIDVGGHAHTITGPSNCFNGTTHIATFNGTAGSKLTIKHYNGVMYTSVSGVTLS